MKKRVLKSRNPIAKAVRQLRRHIVQDKKNLYRRAAINKKSVLQQLLKENS